MQEELKSAVYVQISTSKIELISHSSVLTWRILETGASWAAVYGVAQSDMTEVT